MSSFNPSRRNLLKVGGVGAAGALFLAACSDDRPVGISGDPASEPTTEPTIPEKVYTEAQLESAQVQIRTLASIEALAAKAYQDHQDKVTDPELAGLIASFGADHDGAAAGLMALTDDGGTAEPNQVLVDEWIAPLEQLLEDEDGAVSLFRQVESTLTATYVDSMTTLIEPSHRAEFLAYGGATARRLALFGAPGDIPRSGLLPASDLIPNRALLTPDVEGEAAEETTEEDA